MDPIIEGAARKALEKSTFVDSLEKWKPYPTLYEIKKNGGKNAVGDFGENLVCDYYNSLGIPSRIIKNGHDVLVGDRKKEVKTAFQGVSFWMNQIYYDYPKNHKRAGLLKDWEDLDFVFVKPGRIEIWEIERPQNPENFFKWNNGWMWNKSGPEKLEKPYWKNIVTFNF